MSHSLWFDEFLTVHVAHHGTLPQVAAAAMTERPYPPVFFLVVHYCLRFWDNETGLRLPSAVFGAFAVVAVFLLGQALADSLTGALAAFLFVLTPGVFRYFVDGNAYTLLILAVTLSNLYLFRAVRSDRISDWLLYALFALLGLGTHAFFALYLGAQLLGGLYLKWSARPAASAPYKRFLAVVSVLWLIDLVWVLFYLQHGGYRRPFLFSRLPQMGNLVSIAAMYPGPLSIGYRVQLIPWALLQLLGTAALFIERRKTFWFVAIAAAFSLATITLFLKATQPFVAFKFGLGVFPLACILAAYSPKLFGAGELRLGFPWMNLARGCTYAVIAGYCIGGAAFIVTADTAAFGYQDWRGAARFLSSHATPEDAIVLSLHYDVAPLGYYYKGPARFFGVTEREEAHGLASKLLLEPGSPHRAAWIIVSTLANESPLVSKFTEIKRHDYQAQTQKLIAALKERGLSAALAARFQRINVVVASRDPSRVPSQVQPGIQ